MGRGIKAKACRVVFRAAFSICVSLVYLAAFAGLASADENPPDALQIKSVQAFRHLIESDDMLIILHYNIHYDIPEDQPDLLASKTFLFRLFSSGNETLGSSVPYPFYNDGYDEGCASLYWAASEAPTWAGNQTLRLEGNPTKFSDPPITTHTMQPNDYNSLIDPDQIKDDFKHYIFEIADSLEINWGTESDLYTYTQAEMVLSELGEAYFTNAIPGLRSMCPDLFSVKLIQPNIEEQVYTQDQADEYAHRFDDTPVGDFTDALGDFFGGVGSQTITSMLMMVALLGVVVLTAIKHQRVSPGFLIGFPVLLIGATMGFFSYIILAIITLMCVFLLGYFFFMRHAAG